MLLEAALPTIETLGTAPELIGLSEDWSALWEACPNPRIFQSFEWVANWWKHFGQSELATFVFRTEGRIIGVLPLFVYDSPQDSTRRCALVGSGISDYLTELVRPGFENVVQKAIPEALSHVRFSGCRFDLHDLPGDSVLLHCDWPKDFCARRTEWNITMRLPLGSSLEDTVPKAQLRKLFYYRRRLQKNFREARLEFATPENLVEMSSALVRLHSLRWHSAGQPGVLQKPGVRGFHMDLCRQLLSKDQLHLSAIRINGHYAAVFYGFADRDRTSFYLSGFDPEFAHYNLGTILIGDAIENAIAKGHTEFDFLRGAEDYKFSWGARPSPTFKLEFKSSHCLNKGVNNE
jgi:CelD/BcsL family acetyltransferase involved in cellulose biosynthesis